MDQILSAGIDIGTSTTQLIFSRLTIANTGGFGSVPKIEVVDKEIIYRSPIHVTPLLSHEMIDAVRVAELIAGEYQQAGIAPKDLQTGAVIITGETARKRNAREVVKELAELAGDFVVAAAGPDLESVLAGKGSGAAQLSKDTGRLVANLDVGGGTTNICYFEQGQVVDTACLNIGGRLIQVGNSEVTYMSERMSPILNDLQIPFDLQKLQMTIDQEMHLESRSEILNTIVTRMSELIAEAIGYKEPTGCLEQCITNHGITCGRVPEYLVFSGGVADCMHEHEGGGNSLIKPDFAYGDIGVLLGRALAASGYLQHNILSGEETVNATVVGAGNYSMEVSGSTISYRGWSFPMKNIPVFSVRLEVEDDIDNLWNNIRESMQRFYDSEIGGSHAALSFAGITCPTFRQIEAIADQMVAALQEEICNNHMPILILQEDIGKALGQAIRRRIDDSIGMLCIDCVACQEGDYIDVGEPVAQGKVIPVVVKTLIFEMR